MSILDGVGVVPVIRRATGAECAADGRALIDAGYRVLEVTMTADGALAAIEELAARPGVVVGAGTVLDAATVRDAAAAGARFAVCPGVEPALIGAAPIEVILGAATPTEVLAARAAGCDVIKLFPARELGGVAFLAALRAPFPWLRAFPSGGITPAEADEWLAAGAVAVGIGARHLAHAPTLEDMG